MNLPEPNSVPVLVYTRKSTDAQLEKEVHSLSVQRASAESFIESQKHRGWFCLDERFDDNNISGGTLDRPALRRAMKLIKKGKVKVVVVNRLDRISRSLSQFLELTAFFEEYGVALVSVTQNINTGDAMGRLMLSIIISFAEFERELIRERVTERMHASRKNGQFIGGRPVLGYNIKPEGRELEVDKIEAIRVHEIFALYLELRSVKATAQELKRRGWHNKKWVTREGKVSGGNPFSPNGLHHLLTNPIYIGKVTLKGEVFDGKHDALMDPELFQQVQTMLAKNSVIDGARKRNRHSALLKGLLYCTACDTPFEHTYTKKKNRMYRYYTCSHKRREGANTCPSPSLPAGEIEELVISQILSVGTDPNLQDMVYSQLADVVEKKSKEHAQQKKTAKQQLTRLHRELESSRQFDASVSMIRLLESKIQDAENLLETLERATPPQMPEKREIIVALQNMKTLWPSFNKGEKCAFIKTLIQRVDYDAVEENITLHFTDEGFISGSEKGGVQ